jgi:hypothetical protein
VAAARRVARVGVIGTDAHGRAALDARRRLAGDHAVHLDPAGCDELRGVLARARQAATDQLGV